MHLKLRASLVLAVVVGLLIPFSVASLFMLGQRERKMEARLESDHRRLAEILSIGMQEPLWNYNKSSGEALFNSLANDERVTAMRVWDPKVGTLFENDFPQRRKGRQTTQVHEVLYHGKVIGHVSMEMDNGLLTGEIVRDRRLFIATVLGQLMLSLLLIVALLQVRLLAPIRRLMTESERLARRELAEPFIWRRDDELGRLGSTLEGTRQSLQSLFAEIEVKNRLLEEDIARRVEVEKELQRHKDHLEELVKERTSELQEAKEEADHIAHHDALTGLPNRLLLEDRLQQAMEYARRYRRHVTVAFLDLDNFKLINDTLGHKAGDELLKAVAERMTQNVRQVDTVVRLGGDEFVVIFFDQPDEADVISPTLDRLLETIALPFNIRGQQLYTTCSMGLAVFPDDGDSIDALLMNADAALYRAKEIGRNNYQFYKSEMNARVHEKLAMQEGLRGALANNEFRLVYQPQIDLRSGRVIGVEALIRWQHPQLGTVSPARFIPVAEETGLIVPIGEWVLRAACRQAQAWHEAGFAPMSMSVNVSARQFKEKDWSSTVASALQESRLEARYLELELTESLIMQDAKQAVAVMHELRGIGVRLSIDDFGTGYSSLSTLKSFPVSRLKIDRSFVLGIPEDENDNAIVRTVIALAHGMKLKVLAEGVETQAQFSHLQASGCDEMQGYFFSKPLTAPELEALLAASPPQANAEILQA